MTKKKRGHPDAEEILARPWCYYCERDFDDLKILISHQKAKHFKCERCGRRLNTAGGLSVHLNQVHKENITAVDNALPNRSNLDVEIFGMEGIPDDIAAQHKQRVLSQYQQAEADRRANTGNTPGGNAGTKKPKFESPTELKKRLAEHKAKKAAQEASGSSGGATPVDTGQGAQSPPLGQSPGAFQQPQQFPPGSASQMSFPQPYVQPVYSFPPQQSQLPQQSSPFQQSPPGFSPAAAQYSPGQGGFPPMPFGQNGASFPGQFSNSPPPNFPPGSAPVHMHQNLPPSPLSQSKPHAAPQRPSGLPVAPGLPQRPAVGAPPVNAFQLQQMHQGQAIGAGGSSTTLQSAGQEPSRDPRVRTPNGVPGMLHSFTDQASGEQVSTNASSVDDLIASAAMESQAAKESKTTETPTEVTPEKKAKKSKDKDKPIRLVYSDGELSPEEKMAQMPRYAFTLDKKQDTVLGIAAQATVTGAVNDGANNTH